MTAKTFLNPFHFVPPVAPVEPSPIADVQQSLQDKAVSQPHLLHDRYLAGPDASGGPEHYSGRIVCRLTTQTPCVFGNAHQKVRMPQENSGRETLENATRVDNFSIDGYAAIAGTSLKGMLSTIAEMASGSAMRVLNNRALSIRSSMKQAKSAIGMIVVHEGRRKLLPLALPTFSERDPGSGVFRPTYCQEDSENLIWDEILRQRRRVEPNATLTAIYVRKETPIEFCFHHDRQVVALPGAYPGIAWDAQLKRPRAAGAQDDRVRKQSFLRPVKNGPSSERGDPFEVVYVDPSQEQTLGIVRRLQKPPVSPRGLWFSIFLPVPPAWRNAAGRFELPESHKADLLLDAEEACEAFDDIVTHRFSSAPDDPSCTALEGQAKFTRPTKPGARPNNPGLCDGDIVFFQPSSPQETQSVSIAGIWREGVRWMWKPGADEGHVAGPTLLDSPELRPMNRSRTLVTLGEKLFGWVEDVTEPKSKADGEEPFVTAYKGRVRVSDAVSSRQLEEALMSPNPATRDASPEVRGCYSLKIMGLPKPPCPELYMRHQTQPDRRELRQDFPRVSSAGVTVQGWKTYLLEQDAIGGDDPARWQTREPKRHVEQKSWVRPVKSGTEFWFHVDFENLSERELRLLCYALRPDDEFVHRCGYGKPLQLGGVKIEPQAIALIDRRRRYRSALKLLAQRDRYDRVSVEDLDLVRSLGEGPHAQVIRDRGYHTLLRPEEPSGNSAAAGLSVRALAEEFAREFAEQHRILKLTGTPVRLPEGCSGISYPRLQSQDDEGETYRWFVANRDDEGVLRQPPLPPLSGQTAALPALNMGIAVAVDQGVTNERAVTRCLRDLAREWQLPLEIHRIRDDHRRQCVADRSIDFFIGFDGMQIDRPRLGAGPNRRIDLNQLTEWLRALVR